MAANNDKRSKILHTGYMVPLNLMFDNEPLQTALQDVTFRPNVYSAVLYFKDKDQCSINAWYDQRRNQIKTGYIRGVYKRNHEVVLEMDVDGKSFYLVASVPSSSPIEVKKAVNSGAFGSKIECERIAVPCFAYKCSDEGFTESNAFHKYREEQMEKQKKLLENNPSDS
ncbi:unnamed protein product [Didymodactylos carnosus]|uniref:Uncharacterized protein n=1 Tax=Didymodactylos carnosus TaxID=1234261 RepID=A0A815XIS4_9BILA|nr:unnamed protein product [Didymodactylos carnosus]CAF1558091.1 unnamed protein product [Didymodactylos carnosus]CAF3945987.1 unnamed protein product [Didymodactylos carnosus]CAF4419383.1 unnamed protein product [Didymodactylos carnosus]